MKIGVNGRTVVSGITGLGRYTIEMCRALAGDGHEIVLYMPSPPRDPLPALKGVKYCEGQARAPIKRNIWAQTVLPSSAKADKVDVFWGPAHRLPLLLDRRIARVVTIHDLVWRDMARTMRWQTFMADRWLMKPSVAMADEVVAVSAATATALTAQFNECRGKLSVVYPGLTALKEAETPTDLARFGIDRPFILFVGTLEPRKNLSRLLQAYSNLPESLRQRLLLVLAGGQGWRLQDLQIQLADLQLEPFVRLTGYVSDPELAALYSEARFLAMPSLYEGFGLPIVEANAIGIPVLTSNTSAMPEVAGNAGVLVDPTDLQSIRDGLERLATDDQLHAYLSEKARPNAARFSWTDSSRELRRIFERAIYKRRSRFP